MKDWSQPSEVHEMMDGGSMGSYGWIHTPELTHLQELELEYKKLMLEDGILGYFNRYKKKKDFKHKIDNHRELFPEHYL